MYFPLILAALVIVSAAVLLRQYFAGSLTGDATAPERPVHLHDDDTTDALKAA